MDAVLRALAIYVLLLVVLRLSGRRTLGEITTFDFVLLLIIGEATQQALLGDDFSFTTAAIVIVTLVLTDVGLSVLKQRSPLAERLIDGLPTVLIDDGRVLQDRLDRSRIKIDDILEAARRTQGLERVEQIRFAVLEVGGTISIVPKR